MLQTKDNILQHLVRSKDLSEIVGGVVSKVTVLPLEMESESISGRVSFHQQSVFKLALEFENGTDKTLILKLKSEQIIKNGIELMNYDNDPMFQRIMDGPHTILGYDNSHIREGCFYKNVASPLKASLPTVYGSFYDPVYDIHVILMGVYENKLPFDENAVIRSLDAITNYHAYYYNRPEAVRELLLNNYTTADYKAEKPILLGMSAKLAEDNKAVFSKAHLKCLHDFALHIDEHHAVLPNHNTLTHNDFTPRNIFCQNDGVILYDWELACYQCPEHDLIEFLLFIMSELTDEQIYLTIATFKQMLFKKCGISFTDDEYGKILSFNLLEYCVNRLNLYRVCNKGLCVSFIEKLAVNAERLLTLMNI